MDYHNIVDNDEERIVNRAPSAALRQVDEAFGLLVLLSFAISDFTPAAYQRCSLQRPLMEVSSRGGFRA